MNKIKKLTLPLSEKIVRELKVGDLVSLNGTIVTGRDAAHKYMIENWPTFIAPYLKNGVIYHCGPVVKQLENGDWKFVAAGPTTSIREEPYQSTVIEYYNIRGIIGKGGMGDKTLKQLEKTGAVYFHATGGAAAIQAKSVKNVKKVYLLEELGVPEAFWIVDVENFLAVVTMDSHGKSLHKDIKDISTENMKKIVD